MLRILGRNARMKELGLSTPNEKSREYGEFDKKVN